MHNVFYYYSTSLTINNVFTNSKITTENNEKYKKKIQNQVFSNMGRRNMVADKGEMQVDLLLFTMFVS